MSLHDSASIHRVDVRRQKSPAKDTKNHNPDWCFYHNKFGDKAKKCTKPCKFLENSQAGRQ